METVCLCAPVSTVRGHVWGRGGHGVGGGVTVDGVEICDTVWILRVRLCSARRAGGEGGRLG